MARVRATRLLKGLRLRSRCTGGGRCAGGGAGLAGPSSNRLRTGPRGASCSPNPFLVPRGLGDRLAALRFEYGLGLRSRLALYGEGDLAAPLCGLRSSDVSMRSALGERDLEIECLRTGLLVCLP